MTKEQAQQCLDLLDVVSRNGLPINALAPLITVAQIVQAHIDALEQDKEPEDEGIPETHDA